MAKLEFPWVLHYRYDERGRYGPLLSIGLLISDLRYELVCLIDTGAERSLFDGQYLRAAGLDVFSGRPVRIGGFLGPTVIAYEHLAAVVIQDTEFHLPLLFSTQPPERSVLGRDVLAELCLGLRERVGEIYLAPEA